KLRGCARLNQRDQHQINRAGTPPEKATLNSTIRTSPPLFISAHRPWALFQRVLELAVALLLQHVVEKLCFRAGGPSLRGFRKGGGTTVSRIFISASCSSLQMAGSAVALPACRHGLSLAWRMGLLTSSVPTFAKAQRWANRRMKSYRVLKISRSRCDRECFAAGATVAVICVSELTVKTVALAPPIFTAVVCKKLVPVMTTDEATGPLGGLNPEIVGMTLKVCGETRFPPGSSTVTLPVVAPVAGAAVMYVSLSTVKVPGPVPNWTPVAVVKPCPMIPTFCPTLPDVSTTNDANGCSPTFMLYSTPSAGPTVPQP